MLNLFLASGECDIEGEIICAPTDVLELFESHHVFFSIGPLEFTRTVILIYFAMFLVLAFLYFGLKRPDGRTVEVRDHLWQYRRLRQKRHRQRCDRSGGRQVHALPTDPVPVHPDRRPFRGHTRDQLPHHFTDGHPRIPIRCDLGDIRRRRLQEERISSTSPTPSGPSRFRLLLRWLVGLIELVSIFVLRPITLAVRLFANMVAGHLMLTLLLLSGYTFLVAFGDVVWWKHGVGLAWYTLGLGIWLFEVLVGLLQAYIFTLLSAVYIESSIHPAH